MKKFTVMIIAFISISIQGSAQGIIIEKKNSSYNDSNHQRIEHGFDVVFGTPGPIEGPGGDDDNGND